MLCREIYWPIFATITLQSYIYKVLIIRHYGLFSTLSLHLLINAKQSQAMRNFIKLSNISALQDLRVPPKWLKYYVK